MRGFDLDQASANHGTVLAAIKEEDMPVFSVSVCLAVRVVPWHTFNLVGFGPVNFQACHSKYQGSRRQAETLSLYRCCIDLLGQTLTFA